MKKDISLVDSKESERIREKNIHRLQRRLKVRYTLFIAYLLRRCDPSLYLEFDFLENYGLFDENKFFLLFNWSNIPPTNLSDDELDRIVSNTLNQFLTSLTNDFLSSITCDSEPRGRSRARLNNQGEGKR